MGTERDAGTRRSGGFGDGAGRSEVVTVASDFQSGRAAAQRCGAGGGAL